MATVAAVADPAVAVILATAVIQVAAADVIQVAAATQVADTATDATVVMLPVLQSAIVVDATVAVTKTVAFQLKPNRSWTALLEQLIRFQWLHLNQASPMVLVAAQWLIPAHLFSEANESSE